MWGRRIREIFLAARPLVHQGVDQVSDGASGFAARAKVKTLPQAGGLAGQVRLTQTCPQPEIAGERLEHMLPWSRGAPITDDCGGSCL